MNKEFKNDLLKMNIERYGFTEKKNPIIARFVNEDAKIEITYYGGELSSIEINGEDIDNLIEIPESTGYDDELCYRITDEAIEYIAKKLGV